MLFYLTPPGGGDIFKDMKADKDTITRLVKTARGQLDGILKMIEEDRYCIDISNQLMATDAILRKANTQVLQAHVSGCVRDAVDCCCDAEKDTKIAEINAILEKLGR